jgi:SAM-dependent methyltransferase
VSDIDDNDAPCVRDAGGVSRAPAEKLVHEGYATADDARRYAAKTRKGPLRRLSAARERRLVAQALRGLPLGSMVLDVPCGAGRLTSAIASAGGCAVGVDFARPMLEIAREGGVPLVRASAFRLPFAGRAFAAVACVRLLHHYRPEDRAAILRELARVARDRVVVTVFDAGSFKHRRRLRREKARGRPSLRFGVRIGEFLDEARAACLVPGRVRGLLPGYSELTFVECTVAESRDG